ncbi:hypothetical protein PV379_49315, partial [Streptomyces caniscabiei]|nr:hypothetical protein [Streptomyces caniscabiei]
VGPWSWRAPFPRLVAATGAVLRPPPRPVARSVRRRTLRPRDPPPRPARPRHPRRHRALPGTYGVPARRARRTPL